MNQGDLFGGVPPHQRHSDTSLDAALSVAADVPNLRDRVLACLLAHPDGLTDEEMQAALSMNPNTQRPRRVELIEAGLVEDSGARRLTVAGRKAVVWRASRKKE